VKPLIVRLPNHLGDACMALPALDLLADRGFAFTLAGRAWAKDLFGAYPWPVVSLPSSRVDRLRTLRDIKAKTGLLLTNSFGTALEFRLAGIAAIGYARDGRSWLLHKAIKVDDGDHMVEYYYRLSTALAGTSPDIPRDLRLRISEPARQRAHDLLARQGVDAKYVVLCPVAVGSHRGKVKAWNGFTRLGSELLAAGSHVVAMPGPNETAAVRNVLPGVTVLPESDVATFATVLAGARLVVANDSGPGHLAAAVGAPLISVFGVTEPERTRPWSTRTTLIGSGGGWPIYAEVRSAVDAALGA
jgi:heptosyltransferase II